MFPRLGVSLITLNLCIPPFFFSPMPSLMFDCDIQHSFSKMAAGLCSGQCGLFSEISGRLHTFEVCLT